MSLDAVAAERLESWRADPVTQAYFAELNAEAERTRVALEGAAEHGEERRIRHLGGVMAGLRRAATIAKTTGNTAE